MLRRQSMDRQIIQIMTVCDAIRFNPRATNDLGLQLGLTNARMAAP